MLKNLLIFAAGAAVGYLLREFLLERERSQIVEKDDKTEKTVEDILAERGKEMPKVVVAKEKTEEQPSLNSDLGVNTPYTVAEPALGIVQKQDTLTPDAKEGYGKYFPSAEELRERQKMGSEVKLVDGYLIDSDNFHNFMHGYDKTTIIYDRELEEFAFEDGDQVEDIVPLIGREAYEMLEDTQETIFARNDKLETDFEVISIGG